MFTGSMNISACHSAKLKGKRAWRDTAVRLKGPGIIPYLKACDIAWDYSLKLILKMMRDKKHYRQHLLEQLYHAKSRIWITTPYFIPNRSMMRALRACARNGIDVKLLVPHKSDSSTVKFAVESYYSDLLKAGIRVFEYLPSMIHAKVLIIDNTVTVGSSNMDHRSMFYDLESDVVLSHEENIKIIDEQFLKDLRYAREMLYSKWRTRPLIQILLEKLFICFRAIL